jgi:hypothetical protein
MFGKCYWNSAMDSDKPGGLRKNVARTCPSWGPVMSGIGYWNPSRKSDMSGFSSKLECKEFFDNLHSINSLNGPPLIVRSS